jgi:hypothetical protein
MRGVVSMPQAVEMLRGAALAHLIDRMGTSPDDGGFVCGTSHREGSLYFESDSGCFVPPGRIRQRLLTNRSAPPQAPESSLDWSSE